MSFIAGNSYDIRKVLHVLDQPGYGKGDLIDTAHPAWPNEASEPVRIWSNTLGPNFGNGNGRPVVYTQGLNILQNQDWFYSTDNSAALPGYTPYIYPHPLVAGTTPSPTPNATPTSTPTPTPSPTPTPVLSPTPVPTPTATPQVIIIHPGQQIIIQGQP